jgi:MarC family membrane protein
VLLTENCMRDYRLQSRGAFPRALPMLEELLSAFVLLTLVVDPFGNLQIFNALVANVAPERRRRVILRECLLAYLLLLAFMFGGQGFLALLRLSQLALSIAGGVILFLIALRMIFRAPEQIFGMPASRDEPFIVPLAIPFIAGPSAIATVMLLASRDPASSWKLVVALTLAMLVTALVLAAGEAIQRAIGQRAVEAIQRLMGLILTAIAVQMLLDGIRQFLNG